MSLSNKRPERLHGVDCKSARAAQKERARSRSPYGCKFNYQPTIKCRVIKTPRTTSFFSLHHFSTLPTRSSLPILHALRANYTTTRPFPLVSTPIALMPVRWSREQHFVLFHTSFFIVSYDNRSFRWEIDDNIGFSLIFSRLN